MKDNTRFVVKILSIIIFWSLILSRFSQSDSKYREIEIEVKPPKIKESTVGRNIFKKGNKEEWIIENKIRKLKVRQEKIKGEDTLECYKNYLRKVMLDKAEHPCEITVYFTKEAYTNHEKYVETISYLEKQYNIQLKEILGFMLPLYGYSRNNKGIFDSYFKDINKFAKLIEDMKRYIKSKGYYDSLKNSDGSYKVTNIYLDDKGTKKRLL